MSNQKSVLVTGGLGYIGSHTFVNLIEAGYQVVILDDFSNSSPKILQQLEKIVGFVPSFEKVDMKNLSDLRNCFAKFNFDVIIHFAAFKAVGESMIKSLKYYENNLISLLNLLHCMNEFKIKNLVFSSSCTVYGNVTDLPVKETEKIKEAYSVYGTTKVMSEKILSDVFSSEMNLNIISLRYFNPVGAHETGLIGDLQLGIPANLFPYINQVYTGKRDFLNIYGNDYKTNDGTAVRDYIHVVDLAEAHAKAISKLLKEENKGFFKVYNVGTGTGYSVLEIVKSFEKRTGRSLKYKFVNRRPGDVEKVWADNSLAKKDLGWSPKYTLDEMVSSSLKWEQTIEKIRE